MHVSSLRNITTYSWGTFHALVAFNWFQAMVRIFISHASADAEIARRLTSDLRSVGHDTKVDLEELKLGDNLIGFVNDAIKSSDYVILIVSSNFESAIWQRLEAEAAVWNEIAQDGAKVIVIRIENAVLPPVLGPKVFGDIVAEQPESYSELFTRLCKEIIPRNSASSVVAQAFRSGGKNPFRRVRAEYFEHDPDLLAKTFAPPEALKLSALKDMHSCFVEGSRGTGKSMLLLSMRARNYLPKHSSETSKLFGIYLKLTGGAGCNPGVRPDEDPSYLSAREQGMLTDISNQEFIVYLLESLLSELQFCIRQGSIRIDDVHRTQLCQRIYKAVFRTPGIPSGTIEELLDNLGDAHSTIAEYIRRRFIYGEEATVPLASLDLNALKRIFGIVRDHVPDLQECMIVLLLDEYENLLPYSQRVVNTVVKLAAPDFSVKIAKKLGSNDVSGTTLGQELQETHDYARLVLVYDVGDPDQLRDYRVLLERMMNNVMSNEGFNPRNPSDVLPASASLEVDEDSLNVEIAKLMKLDLAGYLGLPDEIRKERKNYYVEAATYRVLLNVRGSGNKKRFSGFEELSFISSGVIRYFQEIVGVAFHLESAETELKKNSLVLSPKSQSEAVYIVSEHNLTTLSRNVEKFGERLKYFVLDLGDIIKHKLLVHSSEPEAGRIAIEDPEQLEKPEFAPLSELLRVGVREGAFQTKEGRPAFRPKHRSDPQPSDFNLCRIFAPILEISPRYRWRTALKTAELLGLAIPEKRADALKRLSKKVEGRTLDERQIPLPIPK